MKSLVNIGILAFLLSAAGCSSKLKVTSDYDKAIDFNQYRTFSLHLVPEPEKQSISQLNRDRIYNAVKNEMQKKNFKESASPDMMVHVAAIVKNKQSVSSNTNYYGYGGYYRPYGWGGAGGMSSGYTTYNVEDYKEGSIIIDIVDAKTEKLIWEGVGNKEIDTPKDPDAAIQNAVATIMASYPPGAGKK
jgi:hypothetical protein